MSGSSLNSRNPPVWQVFHQRLVVPFEYPVYFGRGLFDPAHSLLADLLKETEPGRRPRLLVAVDRGLAQSDPGWVRRIEAWLAAWSGRCEALAPPAVLEGGEWAKTGWEGLQRCAEWMARHRLDRQSYVVAVGGGAFLDVVGLAAALLHRGVRLVRVPTTVLAQNDVGVGVKNGIDLLATKNLIGTFAPPYAVINDFDFLDRLDEVDWLGGIAEAFKVALIKDRAFFEELCALAPALVRRDRPAMERLVRRCADGRYLPAGPVATFRDYGPELGGYVGEAILNLMNTIQANLESGRRTAPLIERAALVRDLSPRQAAQYRSFVQEQGTAFLANVDDWLESRRVASASARSGRARRGAGLTAGVHVFAFLGEQRRARRLRATAIS